MEVRWSRYNSMDKHLAGTNPANNQEQVDKESNIGDFPLPIFVNPENNLDTGKRGTTRNTCKGKPRATDSPKVGKPTNAESLAKRPEKLQKPIDTYITGETSSPKIKKPSREEFSVDSTVQPAERSAKARRMTQTQQLGQAPALDNLREQLGQEGTLSPETLLILKSIAELKTQMQSANANQASLLSNLEISINNKLEIQDVKLETVEKQVRELKSENEKLIERIKALEEGKNQNGSVTTNEYLTEWLLKVSNTQEMREKKERKLNLIFKGLDIQNKNPEDLIARFLSSHFNIENARDEIDAVETIGEEKSGFHLVIFKNLETKNSILKLKSKCLKNLPFFIEQDCSPLEGEIAWRTRTRAREEQAAGNSTKVGYKSIRINEDWHVWDQRTGQFTKESGLNKSTNPFDKANNVSKRKPRNSRKDKQVHSANSMET